MPSPWIILAILLAGWIWFAALRAREQATRAARHYCLRYGVQFLDGTVSHSHLRFSRLNGRLRACRHYDFDFSTADGARKRGSVSMVGVRVVDLRLDGVSVVHLTAQGQPDDPGLTGEDHG
jgi:hypothetical protein